jgi:hypothetical protein
LDHLLVLLHLLLLLDLTVLMDLLGQAFLEKRLELHLFVY